MLTKRIIPCLDVDRGRVVKGIKFFDHVDAGDPVAQAARYQEQGADELVFYDITADGTTAGYDLAMTAAVSDAVTIPVVASGGAGSAEHMYQVLTTGHADAALAASIFHFGTYTVGQVKDYLHSREVPVRLT